jgi:hypothetical protein
MTKHFKYLKYLKDYSLISLCAFVLAIISTFFMGWLGILVLPYMKDMPAEHVWNIKFNCIAVPLIAILLGIIAGFEIKLSGKNLQGKRLANVAIWISLAELIIPYVKGILTIIFFIIIYLIAIISNVG